jgi:hypothetical protein
LRALAQELFGAAGRVIFGADIETSSALETFL